MLRPVKKGYPIGFGVGFPGGLFDSIFDEVLAPVSTVKSVSIRSDVQETDKAYIVEAELPGFDKKNIKIKMDDGILTISASVDKESENKDSDYACKERYHGSVSRSYGFGTTVVDADKIKAKFSNGILTVELPKLVEDEKTAKEIKID